MQDLKIQKKISPANECKCCKPNNKTKIAQECIRKD